jgi:hypothetical protein
MRLGPLLLLLIGLASYGNIRRCHQTAPIPREVVLGVRADAPDHMRNPGHLLASKLAILKIDVGHDFGDGAHAGSFSPIEQDLK